jgi:hypothetical protein
MKVCTKINTDTGWETHKKLLLNNQVYDEGKYFCHIEHGISVCLPHSRTDEYKETLYH